MDLAENRTATFLDTFLFVGERVMLAEGMRSPWEDETGDQEDHTLYSNRSNSNELLGQILERSTSAPPLPSERNADFGLLPRDKNEDSESVSSPHDLRLENRSILYLYLTTESFVRRF